MPQLLFALGIVQSTLSVNAMLTSFAASIREEAL
jgi:hypothetical protein